MTMDEWIKEIESSADTTVGTPLKFDSWKKRSIYKVPSHVVEKDGKLYKPVKVSLGPYHHDDKDLQPMEEHKKRALCHFLKRSKISLQSIVKDLRTELEYLKEAYDQLDSKWDEPGSDMFLQLMILDGCFILEVLNVYCKHAIYAPDDPTFGVNGSTALPLIKRDMLLLQNQVPLRVIRILFCVAEGQVGNYFGEIPIELMYLLARFFSTPTLSVSVVWSRICKRPCLHILDVYREILICDDFLKWYKRKIKDEQTSNHREGVHLPSASKLYISGIRFQKSSTTHLKDISVDGSTLRCPPIIMTDETISTLANLIAFERAHAGVGKEITSYVYFMTCLLRSKNDVSLLEQSGIIEKTIYHENYVVESLSMLCRDVVDTSTILDGVYKAVSQTVTNRIKKRRYVWWFDLFQTYLKSPWAILSVAAAIFLFTLTSIQTWYTVLGYTHPKG